MDVEFFGACLEEGEVDLGEGGGGGGFGGIALGGGSAGCLETEGVTGEFLEEEGEELKVVPAVANVLAERL